MLLIISNPVSGGGHGPTLISTYVVPFLIKQNIPHRVVQTEREGHAGEIAKAFISAQRSVDGGVTPTLLLSGGDGIVHEVINGLALADVKEGNRPSIKVDLVLLPSGTANALYSGLFSTPLAENFSDSLLPAGIDGENAQKLRSLLGYLHQSNPHRLAVSHTKIVGSGASEEILSVVVTSCALHAALVDTAEGLRASIPGLDRFKEAARRNITHVFASSVTLLPPIQIYDQATRKLHQHDSQSLPGPFSYFLSTVNTDRLEPAFRITPLYSNDPPSSGSMEVIVIRPSRFLAQTPKPSTTALSGAATTSSQLALTAAYRNGQHVDDTHVIPGHEPIPLVEYFRCSGWEWTPTNGGSGPSEVVCADGTILRIPAGGKAVCKVLDWGDQFRVYT